MAAGPGIGNEEMVTLAPGDLISVPHLHGEQVCGSVCVFGWHTLRGVHGRRRPQTWSRCLGSGQCIDPGRRVQLIGFLSQCSLTRLPMRICPRANLFVCIRRVNIQHSFHLLLLLSHSFLHVASVTA